MRLPSVVLVLAALAALLLVPVAPAGAKTPASFFGVIADGPVLEPGVDFDQQVATMRRSRMSSMRISVYWRDVQPYEQWTDVPLGELARFNDRGGIPLDLHALDAVVGIAAKNNVSILPVVQRSPRWAAKRPNSLGSPPSDARQYARFIAQLVARYGRNGTFFAEHPEIPVLPIRRWQVWNEPDILKFWDEPDWAPGYADLLRTASAAIKLVDPNAKVVAAGLTNRSWDDLDDLYAAGAKGTFDIAAIHPFSRRVSNVVRIVELARRTMRQWGDKRPLLLTEVSWSSGRDRSTFNYGWETSEVGQAVRVREGLRALAAKRVAYGIEGLYWYTWMSPKLGGTDSFDYSGLRRKGADGSVVDKPALRAWRETVRLLRR